MQVDFVKTVIGADAPTLDAQVNAAISFGSSNGLYCSGVKLISTTGGDTMMILFTKLTVQQSTSELASSSTQQQSAETNLTAGTYPHP